MLATTFLAHYNAPKFFTELKNPESGADIHIYLSISVYIYIDIDIDIYRERDAGHHLPGTLQRAKVLHRAQEPRLRCGHIQYTSMYIVDRYDICMYR